MPLLGIVVPIFNEEQIIDHLYERVSRVLDSLDEPAKVCLVDDGSLDGSLAGIKRLCEKDSRFGYVSFSRNFGHQTAVVAGLRELDADVYVVIDGDLQDPPEMIPGLLEKWRSGYEVVYCIRQARKENVLKRWAYAGFYRLLRRISYLSIPLDSGDFCLMDRIIVEHLRRMPEHNLFVRGLRTWVGYRQIGYTYDREERAGGRTKYSLGKLFALAYDGLISFSFFPLRTAMRLGLLASLASFLATCYLIVKKLVFDIPLLGWTSTAVLILFMGGIQLFTIGIMGEYVCRIFDEVKGRPLYIIREKKL